MAVILQHVRQSAKNWWLFSILGILLIIGGTTPVDNYITLSIFFSLMIFINGIFDVVYSITLDSIQNAIEQKFTHLNPN